MQNEKGQSLFETIIALSVVTVIVVALLIMATTSVRNASISQLKSEALRYSQEGAEWLRGERDTDWDLFYANSGAIAQCINTLQWGTASCGSSKIEGTKFARTVEFIRDTAVVEATVVVSWQGNDRQSQVETVVTLTDWRNN